LKRRQSSDWRRFAVWASSAKARFMNAEDLELFFQAYAVVLTGFDVDAASRFWAFPAFIAYDGQRAALDAETFRANTAALFTFYRAQGVTWASKQLVEITPLTETVAAVTTADAVHGASGAAILSWRHVYLISETQDGLRLVGAFPDAERAAWRARGTPMGPA
jgi:hypothetical protein